MTTAEESCDISYQLDCGRWVMVEECYISTSMLGVLAGSRESEIVRHRIIEGLPERVQQQFGGSRPLYIKPAPDGVLPNFVFMVNLISKPISDHYDGSHLIVCWLSEDIATTSLPELIKRETRAIEWNKNAVDFSF